MENEKLLPCPLCSSERLSIYHDNYSCSCKVQCECGCSFEYADDCMTKDELEKHVIEKWNKRRKRVELEPCPFCGGSAECRNDGMTGYVQCQNCLARTNSIYSWRDENWKEEVAGYWNSRTQCPEYENKQKAIESLLLHSEKLILVMQAAYIEMCNAGTDNAMRWIENILYEKGLIPSVTKWTTAQDFFDSEIAKLEERTKNE